MAISLIISPLFTAGVYTCSSQPWLAWLGVIPLFLAIKKFPLVKAALFAAAWGLSLVFFAASLSPQFDPSNVVNLVCALLIPTVYVILSKLFVSRFGYSPLALALGCVATEVLLEVITLGGFAHSVDQGHGLLFRLVANFLGTGFVAFIVTYINALLISVAGRVIMCGAISRPAILSSDISLLLIQDIPCHFRSRYLQPVQPRAPPGRLDCELAALWPK